jgi:protein-S-isoprenylcysteine O-methyltransferase Ste14
MSLPPNLPYQLINALWILFWVVWLVAAFFVKRAARRRRSPFRLIYIALVLFAFGLFGNHARSPILRTQLIPNTPAIAYAGALLTAAGIAFAFAARFFLGRNWDGRVVIKQDHTLIQTGPYAFVRHPIYSGLLLALLGTAVAYGQLGYFLAAAVATFALWIKSRLEERLMIEQFGSQYSDYRARVKAFIPWVW